MSDNTCKKISECSQCCIHQRPKIDKLFLEKNEIPLPGIQEAAKRTLSIPEYKQQ